MPFWIWICVIVGTIILEVITMDIVSIWFTIGAVVPLILSATEACGWELQLILFIVISATLILSLRKITMKFLFKNSNEKTNLDAIVGKKYRMLERTDFETLGSVKINGVIWSVEGVYQETIEKDEMVEVVKIVGNKLQVKKVENKEIKEENKEDKENK